MTTYRNPETEAPDRDPHTGAPNAGVAPFPGGGADEGERVGGVKSPGDERPAPEPEPLRGDVEREDETEREADPSISIDAVNGEGEASPDRLGHAGGEVGEGGR